MKRFASMSASCLALGLLFAASGCNEFKYFDIHVKFDPLTFSSTTVREISVCRVTVSGADSASFKIDNCPSASPMPPLDSGVFAFSSFADSGTMNFKLETYTGLGEKPECKTGEGTVAVPVAGPMTLMADLIVKKTGVGCSSVTPVNDGGP